MGQGQQYGGESTLAEPRAEVGGKPAAPGSAGEPSGAEYEHGQQATPAAAEEDLNPTEVLRHGIRFGALRNAYYHSARLRFFEWQHRALMFLIVLTGTAGVVSLFGTVGGPQILAAVTALLATLDLVLDLRGKAQLHDALKRRYYMLLAKLDEEPGASPAKLTRWNARIMKITAEEPVTYRAVDAIAHNEATDTLGLDAGKKQVLTGRQYRWRHFCTFQGATFPYADEEGG